MRRLRELRVLLTHGDGSGDGLSAAASVQSTSYRGADPGAIPSPSRSPQRSRSKSKPSRKPHATSTPSPSPSPSPAAAAAAAAAVKASQERCARPAGILPRRAPGGRRIRARAAAAPVARPPARAADGDGRNLTGLRPCRERQRTLYDRVLPIPRFRHRSKRSRVLPTRQPCQVLLPL